MAVDNLQSRKTELMEQIIGLCTERDSISDKVLAEQELCTQIINEQIEVGDIFSRYHDMWMELTISWPDEFNRLFIGINHDVQSLEDWFSDFESQSQNSIQLIKEILETLKAKSNELNQMKETIINSSNLDELETMDLDHFQWLDPALFPNTQQLDQDWRNKNLYDRLNNYVKEMEQMFSSPMDLLDQMSLSSSCSSSPDSTGGITQQQQY